MDTFLFIINNEKLWVSDIFKMNDLSEEKCLEDLLVFYLKKI